MSVNNRYNWVFEHIEDVDKNTLIKSHIVYMLNKTTRMFKYNNLPDTINQKDLEIQLQINGFAIWKEVNGKLYTFTGGLGGEPNVYYLPTIATIANPALKYSETLKIDEECVVMLNDDLYEGLTPLFKKYATLLTESEISLKYAILNSRIPVLIEADDDSTKTSAELFIKNITEGENYGVISSKKFFEGMKGVETHPFTTENTHIKDLIEAIQYLKGSWYIDLGINAAFNMKREAINTSESTLNDDVLFPLVETMLDCRKKALEKVNQMYGTNISVELSSVWKYNKEELEASLGNLKNENKEVMKDESDRDNIDK